MKLDLIAFFKEYVIGYLQEGSIPNPFQREYAEYDLDALTDTGDT
jgi:hypothetical protein